MIEQHVCKEDFNFLAQVAALQKALISSSVSPVVLWKIEDGGFGTEYNSAIYYDCAHEEEKGLAVVRKRIEISEEDIKKHLIFHKSALELFLDMDDAIVTNDRTSFSEACSKVCDDTDKYAQLVNEHYLCRTSRGKFLVYPSCPRGHYFHIWQGKRVCLLDFNRYGTGIGMSKGIEEIRERLSNFKIRREKLPYISMPVNGDNNAGLYDANFRQNLSTTQLLLERAGLKLE